ncbi:hypothetical protein SAPIO_CDS8796 [Scedosporium apiospermum]|uniref:NACHT domain-containing protein n=1 Tax=Pseudallescheria apiosperma TaxID=563466 RepID=A0A084FXP4_PSEDA|nr:uncharacterized protein SAPIO_CDS8796 [Scedosporium apiospermum]KEZ39856.1 hypothetical protein SAPIO_CDS8796 [Scedosporium apiospermum]
MSGFDMSPSSTNVHAQTNYGYMVGNQHGATNLTFITGGNTDASDAAFIQALRVSPDDSRTNAIESVSDRIVSACWDWILDHATYDAWLHNDDSRLLWIFGGPGKGKTVLAISLVAEIAASSDAIVCDFFCRHMDDKANSASAILRGLIRGLAQNQRRLIGVIRDKYKAPEDLNGAQLRELWGLLRAMLANCIGSKVVYLVIDAIDECRDDRPVLQLLEYIKKEPFKLPQIKVKWLITSRPSSEFERITGTDPGRCIIDLAMEEKASQSVEVFIEQSVNGMAKWNQKTKNDVLSFLRKVAEHTFLYVSMVWKELYQVPEWEISARLSELQSNNPGSILHGMYRVMLDRTLAMDKRSGNTYRQDILRVVLLATRVLNWAELAIAAGLPRQSYPYDHSSVGIGPIAELIQQCGHFLLLQSVCSHGWKQWPT